METYKKLTKAERIQIFFERLNDSYPAADREEALKLLKRIMNEVEDEYTEYDKDDHTYRMHVYGWESGWDRSNTEFWCWIDSKSQKYQTEIYINGTIRILDLNNKDKVIVKLKPYPKWWRESGKIIKCLWNQF